MRRSRSQLFGEKMYVDEEPRKDDSGFAQLEEDEDEEDEEEEDPVAEIKKDFRRLMFSAFSTVSWNMSNIGVDVKHKVKSIKKEVEKMTKTFGERLE